MFFQGIRHSSGVRATSKLGVVFLASFALAISQASAMIITYDDFSSTKPNVSITGSPADPSLISGTTATSSGVAGDYWSSRTFRIITSTGVNRTSGYIENGRLEIANRDGISSRAGISWASRNLPTEITGWTLTADLLSLDTSVTIGGAPVTVVSIGAFTRTTVTLGSGTALAAINSEFFIDSGASADLTLDDVKLSFTCKALSNASAAGIASAIAEAVTLGDGCPTNSVPLPSSLLLLGIGTFIVVLRKTSLKI